MGQSNFNNYKARRRHQYPGGLARKSPVRLLVPRSGAWHVTVDMQGLRSTVRSAACVIAAEAVKPLSAINEVSPRDLPSLVRNVTQEQVPGVEAPDEHVFDVFISHTSEDKGEVVRPLATALRDAGLSVWYDESELRIGDSLRRKIDKGLASSRFGVVVLSRAFFGRGWPEYELDGLVTRTVSGEQLPLPVWHDVTKRKVMNYSPLLADRVARSNTAFRALELFRRKPVVSGCAWRRQLRSRMT